MILIQETTMLLQILNYLHREKVASNQQLGREFNLDLLALQPMLDIWVKRGEIVCCQEDLGCEQTCRKNCRKSSLVYYKVINE